MRDLLAERVQRRIAQARAEIRTLREELEMTTPSVLRAHATRALSIAISEVGVHEQGGNNRGQRVEQYQATTGGHAGDAWCADFGYWCDLKAWCEERGLLVGARDAAAGLQIMLAHAIEMSAALHIPRTGYCPDVWRAAEKQGRWKDRHFQPAPGDVALFDFHQQGEPHHYERVIAALADGTLSNVGGNTPEGHGANQADGDGVFRKVRPRDLLFGFVHFA